MNIVFPRSLSFKIDYAVLTDIIKSQSTILEYSSLAVIPMRIVQELFDQRTVGCQKAKDPAKESKKDHSPIADLYVFSAAKTVKKNGLIKNTCKNPLNLCANYRVSNLDNGFEKVDRSGARQKEIFILILVCILLLARGSIEDDIMFQFRNLKNTAERILGRVFYLGIPDIWGKNAANYGFSKEISRE